MGNFAMLGLMAALSVAAVQTEAGGWTIEPAGAGRGEVLSLQLGSGQSYRFECTPGDVIVTQTAVTKLLDLKGEKIGDGPDAAMPEGAAKMGMMAMGQSVMEAGEGMELLPAQVVKNSAGGWDLTIRLAKNDKRLTVVPRSDMIALFTTGQSGGISLTLRDRTIWSRFLKRCRTGS